MRRNVRRSVSAGSRITSGRRVPSRRAKRVLSSRRPIKSAESYGWVVNDWEAREAYDFACDYFGEEDLNEQIVRCLGSEELAACLAYIFRMNDFREWEERNNEDEDDEDYVESATNTCNVGSRTSITSSKWVAPDGTKYGKTTRRFPGKYLFTRKELRDMVDSGIAEDLAGRFDPGSMNYDIIGISWNDTNGHRTGILIEDVDTGKLYVGNSADATVAKL